LALPCRIGDYTDFYAGIHHATAVGKLFRPDNPLLPNYKWVPIGYHGRASSVVSGTPVRRPLRARRKGAGASTPAASAPSQRAGPGTGAGLLHRRRQRAGQPIAIGEAEHQVCSAWRCSTTGRRATCRPGSTSRWALPGQELRQHDVALDRDAGGAGAVPPYLNDPGDMSSGALDIQLEVLLAPAGQQRAQTLSQSNAKHLVWTPAQLLTHHASNGCNLRPGDLLGTGTISGPRPEQAGSLLELTQGGRQALALEGGLSRRFLEDGDELSLSGRAERAGARSIGFGACVARLLPALPGLPG
jgi:fumarylacetoacetase